MRNTSRTYCDMWATSFYFCQGWTADELNEWMKAKFNSRCNVDGCDGYTINIAKSSTIIVWTRSKSDIPALAHECLHAAHMCLQERGVDADFNNDEPVAYMLSWLLERAINATKRKSK